MIASTASNHWAQMTLLFSLLSIWDYSKKELDLA